MDLKELQTEIWQRLSAVDLTSSAVSHDVIEPVLTEFVNALGLSARPIKWAKDGDDAQTLAFHAEASSTKEEVKNALDRVFNGKAERFGEGVWSGARDHARAAGHGRQLEVAASVVCRHGVLLSIPWRRYNQRLTGDRGWRTTPERTWQAASDALEYAARAFAECKWAPKRGHKERRPSYEQLWLPFVDAYEAGLWRFWIAPSEVIALARPVFRLHGEQLHSDDGPALSWQEGNDQHFFLNDVHVPKELVLTPARELDPRLILRERNVGVRREIVRKIGIERICQVLGAQTLDSQGDYELLLLDLQDGRRRPFLKMKNPSVGIYHIEGVAPECHTVAEALAWRNQADVPPSVLT
jgi:hypothetical protein